MCIKGIPIDDFSSGIIIPEISFMVTLPLSEKMR
jgi:hypothetical protein